MYEIEIILSEMHLQQYNIEALRLFFYIVDRTYQNI